MVKRRVLEFARTDLVTSPVSSSISDIAKIMQDGIIGSVFLTDDDGKIVGLITDRTIFSIIADGKNPLDLTPAEMMEEIVTVDENMPALDVLDFMKSKKISRVGVTNKNGDIVGVVSEKKLHFDRLRIMKDELGIED
jgi:CBS domain-containing protein